MTVGDSWPDVRPAHRRVIDATVAVVDRIRPADLDRPTPCTEWSTRQLLAHMSAQHHGFAAAARGCGADRAAWEVDDAAAEPVAAYAAASAAVIDAFSDDAVLTRDVLLPELSPDRTIPGAQAIVFHLIDYAVHGWDVACAIDAPFRLDDADVALTLSLALEEAPDGKRRRRHGSPFGPAVTIETEDPFSRLLAHVGRRP